MNKIRKISFVNHPILKNLSLDFCDKNGNAADTVIIAGENGCGKSTVINEIYKHVSTNINQYNAKADSHDICIEFEFDGVICHTEFTKINENVYRVYSHDSNGSEMHFNVGTLRAIFSDVDINFHMMAPSSVTSMALDQMDSSRKSTNDLSNQINQLMIDIQALDDADVARTAKSNPDTPFNKLGIDMRMNRFTNAFGKIFSDLTYDRIENVNKRKVIYFRKNGEDVPIGDLSSGEKQIIYRGCFLLKDANALNGAFVLIDEPEISLHPVWQQKIMDYYKGIFTNSEGVQTSQLFVVTHSPFIIHNDNRRNDKVIVLSRDNNGEIVPVTKPEYYKCDSVEVVRDAFSVDFEHMVPTVYLEGKTDEKYFKKALEVFQLKAPFEFKSVGYLNENNGTEQSGSKALDRASKMMMALNLPCKNVFLFDCDTQHPEGERNNVYTRTMPQYEIKHKMDRGTENALILDDIGRDLNTFYNSNTIERGNGNSTIETKLDKMKLCDYLCSLDNEKLKIVFSHLREEIEKLLAIFDE